MGSKFCLCFQSLDECTVQFSFRAMGSFVHHGLTRRTECHKLLRTNTAPNNHLTRADPALEIRTRANKHTFKTARPFGLGAQSRFEHLAVMPSRLAKFFLRGLFTRQPLDMLKYREPFISETRMCSIDGQFNIRALCLLDNRTTGNRCCEFVLCPKLLHEQHPHSCHRQPRFYIPTM